MEMNELIKNLANQFDETDSSEIGAKTVFHELDEYSSLIALSIIAMVDEEYEVVLKGDELRHTATVEDLYNLVNQRRIAKSEK